ncbi:phBC6A51 family helix-turn-helix protein [Caldithrix abyssi]|uniref:Homeodomain-like domain-containing protein n=2 Tax=Caldithrix abyssi DSM 13497 TaxID=880073 RepID=A0A1J1CCV2_CALAY|nr:DUF1804 family protein [Caldithrix abyssi]APF20382.1 Homeodomain-like domain-containing protein [Caldithrix abyssi DSM 13497]
MEIKREVMAKNLLPQAERLYIREGKSIENIATALGVSRTTLYRWKKERNWDERKYEMETSAQFVSEKLMKLLADDVRNLQKLDAKSVDRIVKAIKSIKSLDNEVDILGSTLLVMEQLAYYLQQKNAQLYEKLQELLPDFLVYMRERYKTG